MPVQFENSVWLLLLLLGIPVLLIGLTQLRALHRARAATVVALRLLVITTIALALAGTSRVQTNDRVCVIAIVDLSESVQRFVTPDDPRATIAALKRWLTIATANRQPDDILGIVAFAQNAIALAPPRADTPAPDNISFQIGNPQASNAANAIDLALAMLPPDTAARLVLLSDGALTTGDTQAAIDRVQSQGIRLDIVPLHFAIEHEVLIEFLETPSTASRSTTIAARVGISSTDALVGTLYLRREGEVLDANGDAPGLGLRVSLDPGLQVFSLRAEIDNRPLHRFEAVFEPDDLSLDTLTGNNAAQSLTVAPGAGTILIVDGVSDADPQQAGATLPNALAQAGLDVRTVAPGEMPDDILSLQAYDLVLLQNVAADELPMHTHALLQEYVVDLGGGLLLTGGPDSFGAGGWQGTDLREIIPVLLDIPDELIAPAASLVLVLDSSGSMGNRVLGGSRTQQQLANDAAAIAVRTLDRRDELGVITFNTSHRTVVPFARNQNPETSADRVRSISPGGATNLYPAMQAAVSMLQPSESQIKHMIVLSDGQAEGDPQAGIAIARNAAAQGITVTTIAIGDDADTNTLRQIADAGQGTYYRIIDPNTLPRVFLKEVRVLRNPLVRETPFTPQFHSVGSPIANALPDTLPPLNGFVLSRPRPDVDVFVPLTTPDGDPLLAHWNAGLGRVAAFLSDAHQWAAPWLDSSTYTPFWSQLVRQTARPASQQHATLRTSLRNDTLRITLEIVDPRSNKPLNNATVEATVYAPDQQRHQITLHQTAPGVYEHSLEARTQGQWIVLARPQLVGQPLPPVVAGAQSTTSPEHRILRSDEALLGRLASQTGGITHDLRSPELASLFDREGFMPRRATLPLWPTLLVATLVLALLDMATRRVAWDRLLLTTRHEQPDERQTALSPGILSAIRSGRTQRAAASLANVETPEKRRKSRKKRVPRPISPPRAPGDDSLSGSSSLMQAKQRAREQFDE